MRRGRCHAIWRTEIRQGLILFAHGARDPAWALPFEAVAAQVRQARPGAPVHLAFLEFLSPNLQQAMQALVDTGCIHIEVLPMFLGAGGHVRRDLPTLIEGLRQAHPARRITLHPAVGEIDAVIAAMAGAATALLERQT
jgi:sirohydrochlorin cobaltochelatase